MGNGKVPHRRRRHLQQQGGQQAQDALMADDQQMVKMAAVGQRWDKLADAAGKILKAFAVGGGRMLPVGTPRRHSFPHLLAGGRDDDASPSRRKTSH